MRKRHKEQIIELLNTMLDGSDELGKMDSALEPLTMLEDCQQAAIQIGETIERVEGEGTQAVSCLEKYCEELFHIAELVSGGGINNDEKMLSIQGHLKKIKNLLLATIKEVESFENTIEMVFFPYKASMWDSLESIWIAANKDPRCHAVVVPIPYVDRNPDGSVREEHYEIHQYPQEVPVVDYRDYNLDEEKPDVAFIHNPYDHNNLVTSVHPNYYSYNLKPKVGKLVYVPYFALPGKLDKNNSDFSAYHHVDYIVTQTPEHRKSFPASLPDEMFLPFGSPKFDAIIRKCKNPKSIPQEWKRKMDGKKVFFYNTSLRCAMGEPEDYLKKMGEVFKLFTGRDDVCLVWRPHPLLESTFASMQPEYHSVFLRLRELYLQKEIGIYDDMPCMEDTISWCDAYLGDMGSSVVSSFAMAGKPIYILNNQLHEMPNKDDWMKNFYKLTYDPFGDDRWIVTWQDELWHSPNNDYHYEFVCNLVDQYDTEYCSYFQNAKEYKGKVYIIPANTQKVLVYENGRIRKISLAKEVEGYRAFVGGNIYGKYLWLWPMTYPAVVRIDLETEDVVYDRIARDFYIKQEGNMLVMGGFSHAGNQLALASPNENKYMFVQTESLEKREFSLPCYKDKGNAVFGLERYAYPYKGESYYWVLPKEGYDLCRIRIEKGEVEQYHVQPEGFHSVSLSDGSKCDETPFGNLICLEPGKVLLSPYLGNHYVELDLETGESRIWDKSEIFEYDYNNHPFKGLGGIAASQYREIQQGIIRLSNIAKYCLIVYDCKTTEYREVYTTFDKGYLENKYSGFQQHENLYCCKEDQFNSLEAFIEDNICGKQFDKSIQYQKCSEVNASMSGDCGLKVCNYFK